MQLVRRFNRGRYFATITVVDSICVHLWTARCGQLFFKIKPDQSIRAVNILKSDSIATKFTMPKIPGFTVKKWLEHISHVFFSDTGATLRWMSSVRNIEETCEILKEVKIARLAINPSTVQDCQMRRLLPAIKELIVSDSTVHGSIVHWNLEKLSVFSTTMTLDDLLLSNCSDIAIGRNSLSHKNRNIFMRQWINGSNPRLQYFAMLMGFNGVQQLENTLFENIKYTETTVQGASTYKEFEIEGRDGRTAKIKLNTELTSRYFAMNVIF